MTVHTVALILWDDQKDSTTVMFSNELSLPPEAIAGVVEDTVIALSEVVRYTVHGVELSPDISTMDRSVLSCKTCKKTNPIAYLPLPRDWPVCCKRPMLLVTKKVRS